MQIVTSWMKEGIQQGKREGMQQGMQKGKRQGKQEGKREEAAALVLRLLARRVGPLNAALRRQVTALPTARLEDLGEALLDFSAVDDLKKWLARQK